MEKCYITTSVIEADVATAKTLFYGKDFNENPMLWNMSAFHSAQAIEKSLKLMIYNTNKEVYDSIRKTHNIDMLLNNLQAVSEENFIKEHKQLALAAKELSRYNNARYGVESITKDNAHSALHIAKEMYKEIIALYDKVHYNKREESLCKNENYISSALDRLNAEMNHRSTILTPNGKANPKDGYSIRSVKQMGKNFYIECSMLSRSKKDNTAIYDGDDCAFIVTKNKVYTDKEWEERKIEK